MRLLMTWFTVDSTKAVEIETGGNRGS
jgi:hypothetical protein